MKLIALSFLLLVILEEFYCKTTSSVNQTSTSWGYDYSLSDTRGFKVKHDDKGYQFKPFYNDTSSGLKKHYNSKSVYDQITSPGITDDSRSHSSTNDVINSTSNGSTGSRSNGTLEGSQGKKEPNSVLFYTSADRKNTTIPVTKTHTVTVIDTQTEAPISTDKTSYETPNSSHNIPVGGINGSPSVSSNGQFYKTTFEAPYGPQNTPMYAAPTGPINYPQVPSYGQMYGPAGGSIYGISNGQIYKPPMGPIYGPQTGGTYRLTDPTYGVPTRSMYGYASQNGQMYGTPNGQMYGMPNGQMYVPQNGQMYVPQNGQSNGYPTGSLYGSTRNY